MLNQDKVRLMTRLAIFEEADEGKGALKISKYYKHDYVRWEIIKTILSVTVGYLLVLALVALYFSEYLIANAVLLDYRSLGMRILGIYLVLLVFYVSCALVGYSYKYGRERKNLVRYYKSLKRLMGIYREEEKETAGQEVEEK